jgi:diguanylate cyclase (GGDEF)-like protein/PAS domain S-box-containing protein
VLGLAVALAGVPPVHAQSVPFQRLSLDDGLSQATVYSILQDRRGFMWFGTLEGLNRYDGERFEIFNHEATSADSLSHDWVAALIEDRRGVLWVGTNGGGLNRFDQATGGFTHFRNDPADPGSLSSDRIWSLFEDPAGHIWVGTDGGGLDRLDPETGTFESFLHDPANPNSLSSDDVRGLHQDRHGTLWIGTYGGGLNSFNPATQRFHHFRHDPADAGSLSSNLVRSVYEDSSGALWVGTYDGGLNRFDRARGSFERFRHDPSRPDSLASDHVRTLLEDSSGRLWVATDGGLSRWLPESGGFLRYRNEPEDSNSLSDDRVTDLYLDRGGVLWVGTYGGLNRWNSVAGTFDHYRAASGTRPGLSHSNVMALHEDPDGSLWVGTWGGGLDRFDRQRGTTRRYGFQSEDPTSLSGNRVMSLLVDSAGVLWVGTYRGGLNRFRRSTGTFERFQHDPSDPTTLSANGVTAIVEDPRGGLWVGTYRGGLNHFDPASGRVTRYRHDPTNTNGLSSDRVVTLFQDRAGILWIGTDGGGLNRLDPTSGRLARYRHDPDRADSLSSDNVWCILEDSLGDLWIATQTGGLNRWRAPDRRAFQPTFEHYSKHNGLLSNLIYGILTDAQGDLWLSSNRGLTRFNPATGALRHYDRSHGLQDREFNGGAYHRAASGEMLFGGPNGFNAFFPSQLRGNAHVPPVEITGLLKFNRRFDPGRPLHALEQLKLAHSDSVIAFEFAALDYTAPEKNRYRHKLEGFDADWVETGGAKRVTYTNLDPGRYTFRVKAANNEGVWNQSGAALSLVVAPPPWKSWWAYGLYGLALATIIFSYWRALERKQERAAQLESANRSLELEIAERQRAAAALRKLSSAVEQSPASIMITDPEGRIEYVNPKFVELTGYSLEEVRGRQPSLLQSDVSDPDERAEIWRHVSEGLEWRGELHSTRKSGDPFWEYASISPIKTEDGTVVHVLAANEDITARKDYEEKLLHREHFDSLTELPNRALAFDRLSRAVVQNREQGAVVAVLCVDLDNFKIINDTLGHATGDELLVESARRIEAAVGEAPTVARVGGDEFLVILSDLESASEAESIASKILATLGKPFNLDGRDIFVSGSIGITACPADGDDAQVLLRNADAGMHKAKELARGTYRFFTPAMNDQARRRLNIESNLRGAIESGTEVSVAYQPILDAQSSRVVALEALARWNNAELGEVIPDQFIPIAEETGLIVPLGELVLTRACREAQMLREETGEALRVAVNVSSRQFQEPDLIAVTTAALEASGLPPHRLELEITESLLLQDSEEIRQTLCGLSDLGVRLTIDDFGTEYSALHYLKDYPFDALKIDRSFVSGLGEASNHEPLIKAIIAMAHSLGLEVVGEGVERQEQLELLRFHGCDQVQGFLFSKAVAPDRLRDTLGGMKPRGARSA